MRTASILRALRSVPFFSVLGASAIVASGCATTPRAGDGDRSVIDVESADAFSADRTADLLVKGLACPFCVQNVDKQISAVSGVDDVHVDLATGKVRVLLSEDHPASAENLTSAVSSSGFTLDKIDMPR